MSGCLTFLIRQIGSIFYCYLNISYIFCNRSQIWLTILPKSECQRRLSERNNLSATIALERLDSQAKAVAEVTGYVDWFEAGQFHSKLGPVERAHVVFSTAWSVCCTRAQVHKAWDGLLKRLPT